MNGDFLRAATRGDLPAVQSFIAKGADVNAKRNDGGTALILASEEGHVAVVQALLAKGADVNAKASSNGATALTLAAFKGHREVVQALLAKGADVNAKDHNGGTALILAADRGHVDVVQALLNRGADVNAKWVKGYTALILASEEGHREVVQALIAKGADVNANVKEGGRTALKAATEGGHSEVAALLAQAGAKISAEFFVNVFKEAFWRRHMVEVISPALSKITAAQEANIYPYAYRAFDRSTEAIIKLVQTAEKTGQAEVAWFSAEGTNVVLLVTALPWRTVDVAQNLASSLGQKDNGYGRFLDAALRMNKPDPRATHWLHVLLEMVDGRFFLAAGKYVNSDRGWEAFCYPSELVNEAAAYFPGAVPIVTAKT